MIARLCLLFLITTTSIVCYAQQNSSYKWRTIIIKTDSVLIDTNTLVQQSVLLTQNDTLLKENIDFSINYFTGYLYLNPRFKNQTLNLSYRIANVNLKQTYSNKSRSLQMLQLNGRKENWGYTPSAGNRFDIYKNDGLKMNGSISRGLGFGNNQDVVLNANLNLQMAGRLNNDIDVVAAISDDNNPIQPEGNTQQLQDFDRVFVQLSKDKTTLTVGDFEMSKPTDTYFLNYLKKSRGAQFTTSFKAGKNGVLSIGGEGALSRGRFARNTINGIEGNQGPYRLSGPNGELYIIVISGTEAVYLDGQKLARGEQNDYVIDYNTGEITFMPKRAITQYSRIVVEFQFSDKNYARTVFHLNANYQLPKVKIQANYFTEQDNKDQPFLVSLTDSSKKILAGVGDHLSNAVMNTAIPTLFDSKKIMYRKIDTLSSVGVYIYAPTAGSDSLFYEVRFSNVGQGKGNYKQSMSNANGRVFTWVEPLGGIPQGDYEPVTLLISPKQRQMVSIGTEVTAIKNTLIKVELAQSTNNINTFSELDKNNDIGYGFKTQLSNTANLNKTIPNKTWSIKTDVSYEFVDQNFRYVERYRNVEFDRTWNRLLTNNNTINDTGYKEHITSFRTQLQHGNSFSVYYQTALYNRNNALNGQQHLTGILIQQGKNNLSAEGELLATTNITNFKLGSDVKRYKATYERLMGKLISGLKTEGEQSLFLRNTDSLQMGSYGYYQYGAFIKNLDSAQLRYKVEYTQRKDLLPEFTKLGYASLSNNLNANTDFTQKNGNRFSGSVTYREFTVNKQAATTLKPERTILARVEYDYAFYKRVFVANTFYQIGSGQELRRDFQFVEVLVGQGQYVWKDFNKDGTQQLNEFVLAGFADKPQANYIKVFLPSNSFISTHINQFNQTLNINPAAIWNNKKGVKKIIAKLSTLSALKLDRKTQRLNTAGFLNPFLLNVNDTSLISLNSLLRNTVFFNRSNPTFGADYTYQNQRSKLLLTTGFESRTRTEHGLNMRWNATNSWSLLANASTGNRFYASDFFSTNNYNYTFIEVKPRVSYQLNNQVRLTILYGYFEGRNAKLLGNQLAKSNELGAELRLSLTKQGVINGKLSNYQITFDGEAQSQLGYDMLQGLSVGQNTVWNINYQQRLGSNLQITVSYDGRTADTQKTIHIGRMEARYIF